MQDCFSDLISRFLQEVFGSIFRCFFVVFCAHKDCICFTSFVDQTLDDENRDLYGAIVCVSLGLKKSGDFIVSEGHGYPLVLYIKANRLSVCVDKNWAVPGRFFQSLPVPCGAGDKQGRGRAARADTRPLVLLAARNNNPLICGPIWTNQMVV